MPALTGRDDFNLGGYGVLGSARPRTFQDQGGNAKPLNSYGVWGLLATDADIPQIVEFATDFDPGQPLRAAVGGRNALPNEGVAVYGECRQLAGGPDGNMLGVPALRGFLAGTEPIFKQPVGVYGESLDGDRSVGVMGFSGVSSANVVNGPTGVLGSATIGVRGETSSGVGVLGRAFGASGLAGKFMGNVGVDGDLAVGGDVLLNNGDIAERFEVAPSSEHEAGTVLSIGDTGILVPCASPYDKRVVGVISGAGHLKPAVTLRNSTRSSPNAVVALVGMVYCLADAEEAPIEIGDLITTSSTAGHAMRASDPGRSFGAVIGKALGALPKGRGLIPIIVSLQ